jgi:hypothetical protein
MAGPLCYYVNMKSRGGKSMQAEVRLTDEQVHRLNELAAEEGVSIDEIIQRSIDAFIHAQTHNISDELRRRALAVVGKYASDSPDAGRAHDQYLADIYGEQED